MEYQFYDKLKACELLMRLEEQSKSERKEDGFYASWRHCVVVKKRRANARKSWQKVKIFEQV